MESRFLTQHPEDETLKQQLLQATAAHKTILNRVNNLRQLLEQIPAQWDVYQAKYGVIICIANLVYL